MEVEARMRDKRLIETLRAGARLTDHQASRNIMVSAADEIERLWKREDELKAEVEGHRGALRNIQHICSDELVDDE